MFLILMKTYSIFFMLLFMADFYFTDNLILMRMKKTLSEEKYEEVRSYFAKFTRALVPKALILAVLSGSYLFYVYFGSTENGFSNFQIVLAIKAFLGSWLGLRGILQVFFGIQPFVFKGHALPFVLVIIIVFLSQIMFSV